MTASIWVGFLAQMTVAEQSAISRYRHDLSRIRREHVGAERLRRWAGILRILHENAVGSPMYDKYTEAQQGRWDELKAWVDAKAADERHDAQVDRLVAALAAERLTAPPERSPNKIHKVSEGPGTPDVENPAPHERKRS